MFDELFPAKNFLLWFFHPLTGSISTGILLLIAISTYFIPTCTKTKYPPGSRKLGSGGLAPAGGGGNGYGGYPGGIKSSTSKENASIEDATKTKGSSEKPKAKPKKMDKEDPAAAGTGTTGTSGTTTPTKKPKKQSKGSGSKRQKNNNNGNGSGSTRAKNPHHHKKGGSKDSADKIDHQHSPPPPEQLQQHNKKKHDDEQAEDSNNNPDIVPNPTTDLENSYAATAMIPANPQHQQKKTCYKRYGALVDHTQMGGVDDNSNTESTDLRTPNWMKTPTYYRQKAEVDKILDQKVH